MVKAMMIDMKNILLISFFTVALAFANIAVAVLYKGVDAEGNVIYSDQPFSDAEKFTPPPISVMDAAKTKVEETKVVEEKPAEFKYINFDIISPKNNETIQNAFEVAVSLRIRPELNIAQGHNIWMLMNGKPVMKNLQSPSFKIEGLERGANELQAQIRDKSGKIVVRTRTTIIFVHQASVYR